jgi:hypothetical protein
MNPKDLVYRPYDLTNHEIIINGSRFTLDKILKVKHAYQVQKYKSKKLGKIPPKHLVFNLKYQTISYQ